MWSILETFVPESLDTSIEISDEEDVSPEKEFHEEDDEKFKNDMVPLIKSIVQAEVQGLADKEVEKNEQETKEEEASDHVREEENLLPSDTFSFLALIDDNFDWQHPSPSLMIAVCVFVLQAFALSLLAADVVDHGNKDNPLGIPPRVGFSVRLSQFFALSITLISQTKFIQSCNVLYRGYHDFETSVGYDSSRSWWLGSAISRLLTGALSISVTFMLIMTVDTVRDLLLNLTAVEIISNVDNAIFALASWGYLTSSRWSYLDDSIKNDAEKVKESKRKGDEAEHKKLPRNHCLLAMFFTMFGFWVWIAVRQNRGHYRSQTIYVQIGDKFSPASRTFNGLYTLDDGKGSLISGQRPKYKARNPADFGGSAEMDFLKKDRSRSSIHTEQGTKTASKRKLGNIGPFVQKTTRKVGPFVDDAFKALKTGLDKVGPFVHEAKEKIGPFVQEAKENIGPFVQEAKENIGPFVERKREALRNELMNVDPLVQERRRDDFELFLNNAREALDTEFRNVKEKIGPIVKRKREEIRNELVKLEPFVEELGRDDFEAFLINTRETLNTEISKVKTVVQAITKPVRDLVDKFRQILNGRKAQGGACKNVRKSNWDYTWQGRFHHVQTCGEPEWQAET